MIHFMITISSVENMRPYENAVHNFNFEDNRVSFHRINLKLYFKQKIKMRIDASKLKDTILEQQEFITQEHRKKYITLSAQMKPTSTTTTNTDEWYNNSKEGYHVLLSKHKNVCSCWW